MAIAVFEWSKKTWLDNYRRSQSPKLLLQSAYLDKSEKQIEGTQAKSQQIVAQRLLSCLQYLDATKSSAKDLSLPSIDLGLAGSNICRY